MKKIIAFLMTLSLLGLVSCAGKSPITTTGEQTEALPPDLAKTNEEMFTENDKKTEFDASNAVTVQLNGDTVNASSNAVRISGSTVILSEEATYVFSGTLNDGMIVVNAKESAKIRIVFNGVTITSQTSAPLYVLEADKVFLTLAPNTNNTLANGGSFVAIDESNIDGVIFSKQDLTINGTGTLNLSAPVGHGIVCKDDLVITGGTYTVTSASHGLDANDSIRITNASITVNAGKDAIRADNTENTEKGFVYIDGGTYTLSSAGDGISASSTLQITSGNFAIITGGGSENGEKHTSDNWGDFGGPGAGRPPMPRSTATASTTADTDSSTSIKGLKANGNILITGGSFTLDCADDAVHTNASAYIQGGSFTIETGDDAFHADLKLCVSGGTINITKSYEGLEALNVEVQGGDIRLVASDDGINAAGGNDSSGTGGNRGDDNFGRPGSGASNGSIQISGGTIYIKADGDGIDANGTLTISGGLVTVCGPTSGDTAVLDYDVSASISNATFIGTGSTQMAQTLSSTTQGVLFVRGSGSADSILTVTDADGNVLISTTPEYPYQLIIISSPTIEKGKTYTITAGTATGQVTAK